MHKSERQRILVFFPTFDEAGSVESLVRRLFDVVPSAELLAVDDASTDGTGALLERLSEELPALHVIRRPVRLGVGAAHKLALLYAQSRRFDVLVTMKADLSHAPEAVPALVEGLTRSDFAIGTLTPRIDAPSLFRAYGRPLLDALSVDRIVSDRAGFALESLGHVLRLTRKWAFVPVGRGARDEPAADRLSALLESLGAMPLAALGAADWRSRPRSAPRMPCRICGGSYHVEVHAAREASGGHDDVSPYSCASHSGRAHGQILRCLGCGMTFMRPKLDAPNLVTEYSKVVDPVYLENLPARFATFRRTLEKIRPYFDEGARVLEVGSYCGAFLKVAREQGLDVLGLEPSAWAVEQSARLTSAPVIRGTLDDLPADIGRFDCIVAWDVLEHFADPVDELIKVNQALNMGGRFFFCTVMVDNWFPRLVGRYWPWFMDMHLFYFTDETVRHVLDRAGFSLVESTPYRHITNAKYLLRKLGTIGVPGASLASRLVSSTPWGMAQIPVSLGDIQLFVCTKVRESSELDSSVPFAAPRDAEDDEEARPGLPN